MTLAGDMSLVGTRPPTVDEWDKYELHHRARLATKPGLTGMWQVSGRSNITDLRKNSDINIINNYYAAIYFSAHVDCQRETFKSEGQTNLFYKYSLV